MTKHWRWLTAVVLLLTGMWQQTRPASAATVRHVAVGGIDQGDCHFDNCASIGYAVKQSSPGDVINIDPGTYRESAITIGITVTLHGTPGSSTVIDGGGASTVLITGSSSAITVTVENLTVRNGAAPSGGGIYNGPNSTLQLTSDSITGNQASGRVGACSAAGENGAGGGINNAGGTVTLTLTTVSGNVARGGDGGFPCSTDGAGGGSGGLALGGGIYSSGGTVTLTHSTVSGNQAIGGSGSSGGSGVTGGNGGTGASAAGGGLDIAAGTVKLDGTTVSSNETHAGNGGGAGLSTGLCCGSAGNGGNALGAGVENSGFLTSSNSTLANNYGQGGISQNQGYGYAGNPGQARGGGLDNIGLASLFNTTIAGNSIVGGSNSAGGSPGDARGGGVLNAGSLNLTNTLIALNTAIIGPDCNGLLTSGGHNLLGNNAFCRGVDTATDLYGTPGAPLDPKLGPLQFNGGFNQTMALAAYSPAIDQGDDATCTSPPVNRVDQRGFVRPYGPHCDIGAFEYMAPTAARVAGFGAVRSRSGLWTFHWRVASSAGLMGFHLFAGTGRLNRHIIPAHPGHDYRFRCRCAVHGALSIRVVTKDGHVLLAGG